MKTTHTPGPWNVGMNIDKSKSWVLKRGDISPQIYDSLIESDAKSIAIVSGNSINETLSNARLISAAPELLEQAKALAHQLRITNFFDEIGHNANMLQSLHLLEKAIAKAEVTL